jgi:hypothetical protein
MTQRERKLVIGAGGALVLVVGLLAANSMILEPLRKSNQEIDDLKQQVDAKKLALAKAMADKRELARLRAMSLPGDPDPRHREYDLAWDEYDKYLRDLLRGSGLKSVRISGQKPSTGVGPAARSKKPLYQVLSYTVDASGEGTSVVALLERFYQIPLLHQIKELTIRPTKTDSGSRTAPVDRATRELDVHMIVEALVVDGVEKRSYLMPGERRLLALNGLAALQRGPAGLPLIPLTIDWTGLLRPRPLVEPATLGQYALIPRKNIFYAPAPPKDPAQKRKPPKLENPNKFLVLTDIILRSDGKVQADLYDQARGGRPIKLDPSDDSFTSIPVCRDTEDERLVRGEVVHIGRLEVVFRLKLVSRKLGEEDNGEQIICLDEAKHLYRMKKSYWEALEEEETLATTSGSAEGSSFLFRGKVMGGVVEKEDDRYVEFTLYPKYVNRLYAIRVDESLETALKEPLTNSEIKKLGIKEGVKSAKK